MPPWLAEQLSIKNGVAPGGRCARWGRCRDCGQITVYGLDADWCAAMARADVQPLSVVEEALARLAGRRTYALRRRAGRRLELTVRDQWQLASRRPAATVGPFGFVVVGDHVCTGRSAAC